MLHSRVNKALSGYYKVSRTMVLLGCSPDELRVHLEEQFAPDMTWENYSHKGWHVDHIRPCASFDLTDPEQQRQCFHYTNLQPLWAIDNLRKNSYWNGRKYEHSENRSTTPAECITALGSVPALG